MCIDYPEICGVYTHAKNELQRSGGFGQPLAAKAKGRHCQVPGVDLERRGTKGSTCSGNVVWHGGASHPGSHGYLREAQEKQGSRCQCQSDDMANAPAQLLKDSHWRSYRLRQQKKCSSHWRSCCATSVKRHGKHTSPVIGGAVGGATDSCSKKVLQCVG